MGMGLRGGSHLKIAGVICLALRAVALIWRSKDYGGHYIAW